jgi:uncharacterized membrane protein
MIRTLIIFLAAAAVGFVGFMYAAPQVIMNIAVTRVAEGRFNVLRQTPRVTETSRQIVRPSPDLAYSACAFDLADGPVRIRAAPWGQYWSLALYASNTDNFWTGNDRAFPNGAQIVLIAKGQTHAAAPGETVVESPSRRGIALIRRLAPRAADFAAVEQVRAQDVCARLSERKQVRLQET